MSSIVPSTHVLSRTLRAVKELQVPDDNLLWTQNVWKDYGKVEVGQRFQVLDPSVIMKKAGVVLQVLLHFILQAETGTWSWALLEAVLKDKQFWLLLQHCKKL